MRYYESCSMRHHESCSMRHHESCSMRYYESCSMRYNESCSMRHHESCSMRPSDSPDMILFNSFCTRPLDLEPICIPSYLMLMFNAFSGLKKNQKNQMSCKKRVLEDKTKEMFGI